LQNNGLCLSDSHKEDLSVSPENNGGWGFQTCDGFPHTFFSLTKRCVLDKVRLHFEQNPTKATKRTLRPKGLQFATTHGGGKQGACVVALD